MKKDETAKDAKAIARNDAFAEMLGTIFTIEAKETEATAKKTTKTAVNLLNILSPACLIPRTMFPVWADVLPETSGFVAGWLGAVDGEGW